MHERLRRFGRIGAWGTELRFADPGFVTDAAAELDELGYAALWFPGGIGGDVTGAIRLLLDATRRPLIATGILNIWMHDPADVGAWWRELPPAQQARVMFGLGVGHADAVGAAWGKPVQKMTGYLADLDAAGIDADHRCLAALGPKMLGLARDRTAGAHPYLVTPDFTAQARSLLGPDAWLAPEQGVILDEDADSARDKARRHLGHYLRLPNYLNSWRRMGFTDDDLATVSDRFVDAIFAWGPIERIVDRIAAHLAGGADHVCLQVVSGPPGANDPAALRESWRLLAPARIGL